MLLDVNLGSANERLLTNSPNPLLLRCLSKTMDSYLVVHDYILQFVILSSQQSLKDKGIFLL